MKSLFKLALFCVLTALAACGQFSIGVAPSQVSLKSGESQQFTVSLSNAQNPNGVWAATVGSIDANGFYTAPSVTSDQVGSISFTDSQNGKSAFATIAVISLFDGPAELPRTVPNSSIASTPAPGQAVQVSPGGLQTAINSANCGDTLLLTGSYSGAYTLPAKPCDDGHWIVIRTSSPDTVLPAEGTRINPCYAGVLSLSGRPAFSCSSASVLGVMAKIVATKSTSTLTFLPGANHYRIGPGLELTRPDGTGIAYNVIGLAKQNTAADHIVIDRDWIHGTAQDETVRGLLLSGMTSVAVVDSYFTDFHCIAGIGVCSDAQAIAGGTGPIASGNFLIHNNFLEGAAETILFGGVQQNSATPSDITIRRNHLFKPLTWLPGQPGFVGGKETATALCPKWDPLGTIKQCPFIVKNLFELKNAARVLLEGNLLENVWPGFSQYGESILISGLNPVAAAGDPVYSTVSITDFTVRLNRVAHTTSGMFIVNMSGDGSGGGSLNLPVARGSVHDNLFDDMSPAYLNGNTKPSTDFADFKMFTVSACDSCVPMKDISVRHNTLLSQNPKVAFLLGVAGSQQLGFSFTDNIMSVPAGLVISGGGSSGCAFTSNTNLARLNACLIPEYLFKGNLLIGATNTWPAGNFFPATPAAVMFQNFAGGDYHLQPTSPFAGKGTDGKDPGADVDKVNQAVAGVQ